MAIIPLHPDIVVTVEINGIPLPEYDFTQANAEAIPTATPAHWALTTTNGSNSATIVTKYFEAPLAGEFTLRYLRKPGFAYSSDQFHTDILLDGKAIIIPDIQFDVKDGCDSQVCHDGMIYKNGNMLTQRFRFAELTVGASALYMQEFGQIRLDFFFTEQGETVVPTELPEMEFENIVSLPQRKEWVVICSKSEPLGSSAPSSTDPYYSLGVIPRTPVPTPPRSPTPRWERDANILSQEELRDALKQLRQRQQDEFRE
ncbi:hypothetical protein N0V90_008288 [Kalmusia sp. IMI 367209]|nr:hypothetical protein N0V90_008288 [Kalmusia sp. IMI 367209]